MKHAILRNDHFFKRAAVSLSSRVLYRLLDTLQEFSPLNNTQNASVRYGSILPP